MSERIPEYLNTRIPDSLKGIEIVKRSLFGLTLLLAAGPLMAQAPNPVNPPPSLINFQGRLAKPDGTPVADAANYTITLSLWDAATAGNMRWSQTFSNVTVRNGVFAALLNLGGGFTGTNTLDSTLNNNTYLQIQVGTAAALTPRQQLVSTAYALKAATVPDGSITTAKLSPGVLSAAAGGAAGGDLTGAFPSPQIVTNSRLLNQVSGTLLNVAQNIAVVDQSQPTVTATVTSSAWQTFKPSATGTLLEIDVYTGTTGASLPATLSLYAGQGTGSAPLMTIPITVNPTLGLQSFPITASLTAGTVYTWAIGSNNNLLFGYAGGNALPGGVSDLGSNFDYAFQTLMKSATGSATQINAFANLNMTGANNIFLTTGNLGIGTNAPTARLEVNGLAKLTGRTRLNLARAWLVRNPARAKSGTEHLTSIRSILWAAERPRQTAPSKSTRRGGTTLTGPLLATAGGTVNGTLRYTGGSGLAAGNVLIASNASGDLTWSNPSSALGAAGGDLSGTFPSPSLATRASSFAKVSGGIMSASSTGVLLSGQYEQSSANPFYIDAANVVGGRFAVLTNGNVGIGTNAPTERVQISDYSQGDSYLTIKSAGGNSYRNGFKLRTFNDTIGFDIVNDERSGSNGLNFLRYPSSATGTTALFLDRYSGSVGIGTTAPNSTLDVRGNISATSGSLSAVNAYLSNSVNAAYLTTSGGGSYTGYNYYSNGNQCCIDAYNNAPKDGNGLSYPTIRCQNSGGGLALFATGAIGSSIKNFIIDHPLDPDNKYLVHGSIESNQMMNIYSGVVTLNGSGEAVVQLPDWFEALNKDFTYQLTCMGGYAQVYVADEINNHQFKVAGGRAGLKVSWQVTGIRHDAFAVANPMLVEQPKRKEDQGRYLIPSLYGKPDDMTTSLVPSHSKPTAKQTEPNAKEKSNAKVTTTKADGKPNVALETENAELKQQIAALAEAVHKLQEGTGEVIYAISRNMIVRREAAKTVSLRTF